MTEISRSIKNLLLSLKTKEEWLKEGNTLNDLKRYKEAEQAHEKARQLGYID